MELYLIHLVIAAFFLLLMLRLLQIYRNFKKKTSGFPFFNIIPYIIYCHLTGKITKDTPPLNVVFEKFTELGKQYWKEGLFMIYSIQPSILIYSEEAIKTFSIEKAALDKSPEYDIVADVMADGLGTSNGQRWKKHRKLINPAFSMGVLKEKVPLCNKHALNLVTDMKKLVGKPSVDICENLKFHYFNALFESVFGLNEVEEYYESNLVIHGCVDFLSAMTVKRFMYPWYRPKFLLKFSPFGREFIEKNKKFQDIVRKIISHMQKCVFSNNNDITEHFGSHLRKSFAYILLNHHRNDPTFTLDDVQCEVTTMLITGYDTVAISSMWCLYLLGLHPEVQEKIYNEVEMTASDYITYEETVKLTYLEAVIMESLRLFPVLPIFARNLTDDVQCGKYKVLKGTSIVFFPYLSHRNPDIYPEPEKFIPERFLNTEAKKKCSFMPFAEGSRSCIGKNYAVIEMKIFLSHIIRNFKITSLDRREDVKLSWSIALVPLNPLRFKVEYR